MASWDIQTAAMLKQVFFDAGLVALGISLGLIFLQLGFLKYARVFFSIALGWLFCLCLCGGAEIIARPLSNISEKLTLQSHTTKCADQTQNIVVLAGGATAFDLPSPSSYYRAELASQVIKQQSLEKKTLNVFLAGGYTKPGSTYSEASTLDRVLRQRLAEGYAQHRFYLEEKSKNTAENALYVDDLFQTYNIPRSIILITETLHLPRSYATFLSRGFKVCPIGVDNPSQHTSGLISFSNGSTSFWVLNEYFGILGYWSKNWITPAAAQALLQ